MAEYATDEEQVEAIKKWWSENGWYLVGGLVLGLGLLVGWNYWKTYRVDQGEQASAVYAQLASGQDVDGNLDVLQADYEGTPYAVLGELLAAKAAVVDGDLEAAEKYLRSAAAAGGDLKVSDIARIRLARVLLAAGKADDALKEVDGVSATAYLSLKEETRGDSLVALGRIDEAREAYDRALLSAGGRADFLQLKRDNLGSAQQGSAG